jgi:predicted MFS family arabinose efflux permease
MAARFMAGVSAGLSWGLLGGYARRMVVDSLKGRAVALAMAGTPVALSIGTPLGTYLGGAIGWRGAFVAMSAVAALLLFAVARRMPDFPGQPPDRPLRVRAVIIMPGVRPVLLAAFLWVTAHYVLYTYAALFAAHVAIPQRVDLLLAVFGLASLSGIWLAGAMVDHRLRAHVLGSLVLFAVATAAMALAGHRPVLLWPAVIVWGITFGGAATSIQTAASDAAGDGANIVSAMATTVWNAAIALGGALGALILKMQGVAGFFWVMLALILISLIVAAAAHDHGFRPGARAER